MCNADPPEAVLTDALNVAVSSAGSGNIENVFGDNETALNAFCWNAGEESDNGPCKIRLDYSRTVLGGRGGLCSLFVALYCRKEVDVVNERTGIGRLDQASAGTGVERL
jgi:hypothetical protein